MKTALISDIHGNFVALEAVLRDLETDPVDQVVCLGDVAQGGAQPVEVIDALRELGCPIVMGNSDAFLLDPNASEEAPTETQLEVREWTNARLGTERLELIRTFEPTIEAELGRAETLLAFHGSPSSYDAVLLPRLSPELFEQLLGPPRASILAGGHVHQQYMRRYQGNLFVNPGSVGLSYDVDQPEHSFRLDHFAAYARLTTGDAKLEVAFRRVPFDVDAVIAAVRASGLPDAEGTVRLWAGR